ncbi:hypothetical protein HS1genome_1811 [Sulfodiicoccus acidiphilus]|uniref:Uncharacterized protein n=1 Tax=Sulfodiicoccus acidiphilus TaxID=1670455 RepID=A0A348B5H0_9CREN|nr:hypothetical protein [Sulfodiicoccus acidiphilus]BBD73422.1 hypothetical protein HS1genome_1811 [Sulfodiicoccus acidiphilus]GGT98649.1 hypothetical protein GCM10007116_15080 [Sulfodiicoccus acidiphilus]
MSFLLLYFRSTFADEKYVAYDQKVISYLEKVEERCGIHFEVKQDKEGGDFYNSYLSRNSLVTRNTEALAKAGVIRAPYASTPRRKFKTRSGYVILSESLHLFKGENLIWAGSGNPTLDESEDEVLQFLRTLSEDCSLVNRLEVGTSPSRSEDRVISDFMRVAIQRDRPDLVLKGVKQSVNVYDGLWTGNPTSPQSPVFVSIPDLDLVEVSGSRVTCYEAKRDGELQNLYAALGEAMLDLLNPNVRYGGSPIEEGGVCDEVYILVPEKPRDHRFEKVLKLTPVGLVTSGGEILVRAKKNPFLNENKKKVFLSNINLLEPYVVHRRT